MNIAETSHDSVSTADLIARSLRTDILKGKLKSKQPLRQDEIASQFGVSKIPVREALFQLKAEGLVTFSPNRGATVSELSPAEVDEMYIMRLALETVALQRAIPRLTVANLTRAEEILDIIDQEPNVTRWGELNWEFHSTLYYPANLPRLIEYVKTLHIRIARYVVIYLAAMNFQTTSQSEHRAILAACRRGNIATATASLAHHCQSTSNHIIAFLSQRESERLNEG